jgi:hypothetical protein
MHKILASAAAALSAAVLTFGVAGPANAELYGIDDPSDTSHGSDLLAVQIRNAPHRLVIDTIHTNLRRDPDSGSSGAVYIDTDPQDAGPEFVFVGGYFTGTDYQLLHTEGFGHDKWGNVAGGDWRMTVDYAEERVHMWMSRAAIDRPGKVRVAIRVVGTRTDGTSNGLVDWLGQPRSFTPWIRKG